MSSQPITTRIKAAEDVAGQIRAYTLETTDGSELPAFTAGAHIDVLLGNDLIRQYSLCSDPAERHHYRIAVLHEPDGRGGSDYMHRQLKAGDELRIHAPRNHFELDMSGDNYLLLAGGIGITPIMLMALQLQAAGKAFTLHYLCRTPEQGRFSPLAGRDVWPCCGISLQLRRCRETAGFKRVVCAAEPANPGVYLRFRRAVAGHSGCCGTLAGTLR